MRPLDSRADPRFSSFLSPISGLLLFVDLLRLFFLAFFSLQEVLVLSFLLFLTFLLSGALVAFWSVSFSSFSFDASSFFSGAFSFKGDLPISSLFPRPTPGMTAPNGPLTSPSATSEIAPAQLRRIPKTVDSWNALSLPDWRTVPMRKNVLQHGQVGTPENTWQWGQSPIYQT